MISHTPQPTDIEDRKRADDAPHRTRHTYLAEAQQLCHTASFSWNLTTGEIFWSEKTFGIFGYDSTATPSIEMMMQRVHPEDVAFTRQVIDRAAADRQGFDFEHRLLMPDGAIKYLHVLAHAVTEGPDKLQLMGAFMDITALRTAEQELRNNEQRNLATERQLRATLDTIPVIVWTALPNGANDFHNQRLLSYTKFSPEELRDDGWTAIIHPDDAPRHFAKWRDAAASQTTFEFESRLRRFDGQYRWFLARAVPLRDETGNIVRWYGINVDIEDRKRAEARIKQAEYELQMIVDAIPALAWSATPDGAADFVNKGWTNYTGLSLEQTRGIGWSNAIHPDDRPAFVEHFREVVLAGEAYEDEARIRQKNGQYRWFLVQALPLRDESGRIIKWYGSCTDIEDRKQAEEDLREAQAELSHVSRVTTLGELTASIAHEVNQPLTAIAANSDACLRWLSRNPPRLDEVRTSIEAMISDCNRASSVIAKVRALAKKSDLQKTAINVNDVIRDSTALVQRELHSRSVSLAHDLSAKLPPVFGDRVQLQQVIINLIMNGIESMSAVTNRPHTMLLRSDRDGGGNVIVELQDSGVGIDPERIDRLFEPFFTTKHNGLGMGLSISRSIVEAHGGRLTATSDGKTGATFRFTLPFHQTVP
jgi:PAS domain S-box-containing protein